MMAALIAGAAVCVAVLNMLLLPGHLTRICLLAGGATDPRFLIRNSRHRRS